MAQVTPSAVSDRSRRLEASSPVRSFPSPHSPPSSGEQSPDPSCDMDGVFGTHRSKKCRKRLLFGVIYFYQTFKTTSLENIPYEPFGVANLELATFSL